MARNITPDCIDGGHSFSLSSEQLAAIVEITGYSFGNEQGKEIEILCREHLIERDFERKRDAGPTSSSASRVGMMRGDEHRSI